MIIPDWYIERRDFIETAIQNFLHSYFQNEWILLGKVENKWLKKFREAVFYSVKWWKKLRAILALEFYLTLTKTKFEDIQKHDDIVRYAIALELVHAFSLVHDDLPSIDNDTLRRGQPSVWSKFGESTAVLVGDCLSMLAFEILTDIPDAKIAMKLSHLLARSSWYHGMLGGQIDDLYFERNLQELSTRSLIKLHNRKTWALIRASVQGGIVCSGKIEQVHKLSQFGEKLWLAFQIKDDILDVEGSEASTGKSVGWEEKWFVYFMGLQKSKHYLNQLIDDCMLTGKLLHSSHLLFLVQFVQSRES